MNGPHQLLNAYLDNELTEDEQSELEAALAADAELRGELKELEATRSLLRDLPEVVPGRPVIAFTSPPPVRRRGPGRVAMAVAGVAAVWLVILTVGVRLGSLPIVPDVDELALQHASASDGDMEFQEMAVDQMAEDPAVLEDVGHGMTREAIFQSDDVVQVRYSDGDHGLSVFHQPGEVDWDAMPPSGDVAMMDDGPVWTSTMGDVDVLVTERGDLVVTIVADGNMDQEMTMAASSMVPTVESDDGLVDRLVDAPKNLFDRF